MFFHPLDFLIIIAFGLSLWAQFRVKGNFEKYAKVYSSSGLTGAEIARKILDRNGLVDVPVEHIRGALTDHYDPMRKTVRLSDSVYGSQSIAAVSVAAHEVGHAIQHSEAYGALVLRHKMFPIVNFTSGIAPFLLFGGFLLGSFNLIGLGIIFFSAVVAFQLVTLPVEYNASSRAKHIMISEGLMTNEEERGVSKVLNAAALTYVAAALLSLLQLFKFIAIFSQGNRE
ncbi:peptidase [Bacillus sp. UMB0899]|uniref:zinc metallopeptidase n=1 Tax=Metabacillus schmidteae TaxID=2730405 RepID=UPI000C7FD776|nr:zinc metallopeptidase [Metabacillus schmidteae]PMC40672.1 peptidase [Bacillus sp. UMB0899]